MLFCFEPLVLVLRVPRSGYSVADFFRMERRNCVHRIWNLGEWIGTHRTNSNLRRGQLLKSGEHQRQGLKEGSSKPALFAKNAKGAPPRTATPKGNRTARGRRE